MDNKGAIVRFLHFTGTTNQWNEKIDSGIWNNAIVFGYIFDGSKVIKKIYAGQDSKDMSYVFDFSKLDGISTITFSTYEEALDYLQTSDAKSGQLINVEIGEKNGNYIVLQDDDTLFLQKLNNECVWIDDVMQEPTF